MSRTRAVALTLIAGLTLASSAQASPQRFLRHHSHTARARSIQSLIPHPNNHITPAPGVKDVTHL